MDDSRLYASSLRRGSEGPDDLTARMEGESLFGLGGADILTSAFNATRLYGGAGADDLRSDLGIDFRSPGPALAREDQFGGSGDDTMSVAINANRNDAGVSAVARLCGGAGADTIDAHVEVTSLGTSVAKIVAFGGAGNDVMTASALAPIIGDSVTMLRGGAGHDTMTSTARSADLGGVSRNLAWGEAGDDRIAANATNGSIVNALAENTLYGGAGRDVVDAYARAGSNVDSGISTNVIHGDAGADRLTARLEDFGGNGTSIMTNRLFGGDAGDRLGASVVSGSGDGASYYVEADNRLHGGGGDDELNAEILVRTEFGHGLRNQLFGGQGDDALRAAISVEAPFDPMRGVSALNVLSGGAGDDALVAEVTGEGSSRLFGGAGDDALQAIGGDGNALSGGAGADVCTGSPAQDVFVLDLGDPRSDAPDVIVDFDSARDVLAFAGIADGGAPGLADDIDRAFRLDAVGDDIHLIAGGEGQAWLVLRGAAEASVEKPSDLVDDPARQIVAAPEDALM